MKNIPAELANEVCFLYKQLIACLPVFFNRDI